MKKCWNCKKMVHVGGHDYKCDEGITILGLDPVSPFFCSLWVEKYVEFEGKIESGWTEGCVARIPVLYIKDGIIGSSVRVRLETIE